MRVFKTLFFVFFWVLFPIVCFTQIIDKPHLIFHINSESLILDKTTIKDARIVKNDDVSYGLIIELTPNAAKQLANISNANAGKTIFFYSNDKLISKAIIQSPLGDKIQIHHFLEKEGKELIDSLKNDKPR